MALRKKEIELAELQKLFNDVVLEFYQQGIEVGKVNEIGIKTRYKSCWGKCVKKNKLIDEFNIYFNNDLMICPDEKIKIVIAHELIHTLDGCFNHGKKFMEYAKLMNEQYGYIIKKSNSYEELGFSTRDIKLLNNKNYKYVLVCTECGKRIRYTKEKDLKNYENHFNNLCPHCNIKMKLELV